MCCCSGRKPGACPPTFWKGAPEQRLRLPMGANSRSLNLSNAVAITLYEAWRQLGYPGAIRTRCLLDGGRLAVAALLLLALLLVERVEVERLQDHLREGALGDQIGNHFAGVGEQHIGQ